MRKRLACLMLIGLLLLQTAPPASAGENDRYRPDLSALINNEQRRTYMEIMVSHYMQTDSAVRNALENGYSAMFLFEGGSDNMDDRVLSDISYYRVSTVCLVFRLGKNDEPYLTYFNQYGSTLPDRPLEYGAWKVAGVGDVGPATICDGTYELDSVKHGGKYEALHLRTSESDLTIPAVYMTPEGFCMSRADMINIHTRNVNHILEHQMWSAGCVLIGDGDFGVFSELIASTYYSIYDNFAIGERVGVVTLDRQLLKEEMYELYENRNAVDVLLAYSQHNRPEAYLDQCENPAALKEGYTLWTGQKTDLMTLPCSHAGDVRSLCLGEIPEDEALEITGSIVNLSGNTWYAVKYRGQSGYVFSGHLIRKENWFQRILGGIFG